MHYLKGHALIFLFGIYIVYNHSAFVNGDMNAFSLHFEPPSYTSILDRCVRIERRICAYDILSILTFSR